MKRVENSLDYPEVISEDTPLLGSSSPNHNQRVDSSRLSHLIFGWLNPLLELGNLKGQLDPEDLDSIPLAPEDSATNIKSAFKEAWEHQQHDQQPSLLKALFMAFGSEFIKAGILKAINDCLQFVGPHVLTGMVQYVRNPDASIWHGLGLTLTVTLAQVAISLCIRHYFFRLFRVGLRVRTALVMAIYEKSLALGTSDKSSGQITNLMSVDTARIQGVTTYLHVIWSSFLQIGLALYFLWKQLGPSCLAGVAVIILTIPSSYAVGRWTGKLQKQLMKAKDERVEINNEVISNVKIVKLQAWEEPFRKRVESLRDAELKRLFIYVLGRSCSILLFQSAPLLVALATFTAFVLSGNELDVAPALTALALFDILRFPLFMLPNVVNSIVEANIAKDRVTSFLTSPEYKNPSKGYLINKIGVSMNNATFVYDSKRPKTDEDDKVDTEKKELSDLKWELQLMKSQLADAEYELSREKGIDIRSYDLNLLSLRRVNFRLNEGEFMAIVGGVGSGKSTFLKSILGEVRRLTGELSVNGKLGYFGQDPFIMNDTVKGNILFGSEYKIHAYNTAIKACALHHDLEMLPSGDETEIGEKGITMSGGQKARIALARVLYHNADIILLDDPLAAVDAHVGRHLFEKAIIGELLQGTNSGISFKKKTVILVTNALQYLNHPSINRIVVLKDGRIEEEGSYSELLANDKGVFRSFLNTFNETREESSTAKQELSDGTTATEAVIERSKFELTSEPRRTFHRSQSAFLPRSINMSGALRFISRAKSFGNVVAPRGSFTEGDLGETIALMTDEMKERKKGKVDSKVYMSWIRAAGGLWVIIVILLGFILGEGTSVLSKWWLTYWSGHAGINQVRFLEIYTAINLAAILTGFLKSVVVLLFALRASRSLFSRLLDGVLKAPMSFFDTTPTGRIVNRFSKDVYSLDEELPGAFRSFISTSFGVFSTLAVVTGVSPVFAACLVPILYIYKRQQLFYTTSYRELKRLDSIRRSPIYALFGETLDGVTTIRAFTAQIPLMNRMINMLDQQQHAYFLTTTAQCWLGVRLESIGACIIGFACLTAVISHDAKAGDEQYAGLTGLAISYALAVTSALTWAIRSYSDFEASMVAVERIKQYGELKSESPHKSVTDEKIEEDWPQNGKIEFIGVKLRYRPGLPLVLKGLNLSIPEKSKVGVVGRTGAGKSTLMTALLRLVELDRGLLVIDGVDTSTLGLTRLRSKIAVIPQDPVLFSGTIKYNLDPFGSYSDDKLLQVLSSVGLMSLPSTSGTSTNSTMSIKSLTDLVLEGGTNFSVGEKQLIVIARALLCGATVVICDEATAAVDAETDARIQRVLRIDFKEATVITIAHRLNTIMDSDYVLVMDDGQAAEFDSPSNLLAKEKGLFKELVDTWEEEHK